MSSLLPQSMLGALVFCQVFLSVLQYFLSALVFCQVISLGASVFCQVFCFCMPVFHFGKSLSSDGQDVQSPVAGRASSFTHLAAGVLISVRQHSRPVYVACIMVSLAMGQCNFAREAPLDSLYICFGLQLMVLLLGCWSVRCPTALDLSAGLKFFILSFF